MNTCLIEIPLPAGPAYAPSATETREILRELIHLNPGRYLTRIEGGWSPAMLRYLDDEILYQDALAHAKEEDLTNDENLFDIVFDQVYNKAFVSLQKTAQRLFQSDCWHYQSGECRGCHHASSCFCGD